MPSPKSERLATAQNELITQTAKLPAQLTLYQAADLLNVSTTYVKGLLAYKARDNRERQVVLDELTREAQEQGPATEPEPSNFSGRASRLLSSVGVPRPLLSRPGP